MHLLLIDDEELELLQLEYIIQTHFSSWKISKAQDAVAALYIISNTNIDLALVDIHLPGKNGIELAKELIENHSVDTILVTAYQSFEYAQNAIRMKVIDYITKPIIEEELINVLQQFNQITVKSSVINNVLDIIHHNYSQPINLQFVSEQIHMNPTYLSRKFHKELQISFSDYITQYRLKMSKKLLLSREDYSISTISEMVGFNSQHYYSSQFKKLYNQTPSEFRSTQFT